MKNQIIIFPSLYTLQNYQIPLKVKNLGLDELNEVIVNPLFEWDFINILVREPEDFSFTYLFLKFSKNKYIFNTKIYNKPYLSLENFKLYLGLDFRFLKNKIKIYNTLICFKARFLSYNTFFKKITKFNKKKKKSKKKKLFLKQKFLLFYILNLNSYFAAALPKNLILSKTIIKNKNYKKIVSIILQQINKLKNFFNLLTTENSIYVYIKRQNSIFLSTKFMVFLFKSTYFSKVKNIFESKTEKNLALEKNRNLKIFFKQIKKINPLHKFKINFQIPKSKILTNYLKFKILI